MAGFNLPITIYTPQQLDQLARAAFKTPALNFGGAGGGGGMGGMGGLGGGVAAAPGISGQDLAGLGQGIGGLGAALMKDRAGGAPGPGAMLGEDRAIAPQWPPPVSSSPTVTPTAMADGGPVMPDQYYTVGERGPETFVPAVPGYIVPNEDRDFFGGRRRRR